MMRMKIASTGAGLLVGTVLWVAGPGAQAQPPVPRPPAAAAPPAPVQTNEDTTPLAVPTDLVVAHPGGLMADQVSVRAAGTSWSAKASMETVRGAAARVDEAWAGFLPRLSGIAKYTRLSKFTPNSITFPAVDYMGTVSAGPLNGTNFAVTSPPTTVPGSALSPIFLDNYLLQGTLTVPISDYFLRIDQNYTAATRSEEAARWDFIAARAASGANGQVAYYTWLRARGAVIVAVQAVNDQRTHLRDARNQFSVGNASKADVLRAETAVASADLALERAKNLADLSEKQVRVAIHAPDDEVLVPGEALDATPPPMQGNVHQMSLEARNSRAEVKSADANAAAAREQAAVARAGRYPVISAFADGIAASPHPRYFPATTDVKETWDLGAQMTWSPNDLFTANSSVTDAESRAAATEANKNNLRDNIDIEVTQDTQAVKEADFAIDSSGRELASAEEAYRVARELFNNGRGTSTTLTDAETDLTRARLDLLNARADARIARIRLDHALGRDAR
jgi:outer membrane protein